MKLSNEKLLEDFTKCFRHYNILPSFPIDDRGGRASVFGFVGSGRTMEVWSLLAGTDVASIIPHACAYARNAVRIVCFAFNEELFVVATDDDPKVLHTQWLEARLHNVPDTILIGSGMKYPFIQENYRINGRGPTLSHIEDLLEFFNTAPKVPKVTLLEHLQSGAGKRKRIIG